MQCSWFLTLSWEVRNRDSSAFWCPLFVHPILKFTFTNSKDPPPRGEQSLLVLESHTGKLHLFMPVWNHEVQTQFSAISENSFSPCTSHVGSSVAWEFCEGISDSVVYALTLICRLQTNTLCKCLSQTQNSGRSWSPFCIQTQGDWFWFYTHILPRAGTL